MRNRRYYGRNPTGVLSDLLSLGYDRNYPSLVTYDRLPHMICRNVHEGYGYIYVFANVGNSPLMFNFKYTHGFEGGVKWRKIIRVFDGDDTAGRDPSGVPETQKVEVHQGDSETIFQDSRYALPLRSFAVVNVINY